ncbi:hypothetical protein [Enterobacter hormaechei]|uniref:hypothetical protein n=1 Tax=Enterobacter hormaechei TaxID=158836 RepID=UPI00125618A6|nr:Uncharacterised protein [Enterobacter hormaechei]
MQNEQIFYMDKAVDLFNSLREEKVSERIDNAHLGAMGAVNVQVWTSVLGGTLQYETSNGGCTLRVIHTDPVLEGNIPFEQWLSQQTGTIDVECGCVMTEVFFHWLRVAYEAGNSPVIPDDLPTVCAEAYQVVGVMAEALGVFDDAAIQKVMDNLAQQKLVHCDVLPFSLPAAPQQEAKNV